MSRNVVVVVNGQDTFLTELHPNNRLWLNNPPRNISLTKSSSVETLPVDEWHASVTSTASFVLKLEADASDDERKVFTSTFLPNAVFQDEVTTMLVSCAKTNVNTTSPDEYEITFYGTTFSFQSSPTVCNISQQQAISANQGPPPYPWPCKCFFEPEECGALSVNDKPRNGFSMESMGPIPCCCSIEVPTKH
eukprot:scaffold11325_cov56-Attheya_sp.AAC.8